MRQTLQNILNFFSRTKSGEKFDQKSYDIQIEYADFSHLYNPDNLFTDEFYSNLIRTISWTEKIISGIGDKTKINYSTILRSTNPEYDGKPFYRFDKTYTSFPATPEISFNYLTILDKALAVRENEALSFGDITQLGQIIEFEIDVTTHDGAPCTESEGFIDESDIPPIDTWFYLTKTKLYCWIPTIFIEKMQNAIDVEILGSYNWIKESNPILQLQTIDRLKAACNIRFGIIGA